MKISDWLFPRLTCGNKDFTLNLITHILSHILTGYKLCIQSCVSGVFLEKSYIGT